jgi:hypothetical protein
MEPRFKFYLSGQLVTNPAGWDRFTQSIDREDIIAGILEKIDGIFEFYKDGYELLLEANDSNIDRVEVLIKKDCSGLGDYKTVLTGYINISDVEFNRSLCTCKAQVEDNSFYASLNNNKSLEVTINGGFTKNGLPLDDIDRWEVEMFDPCTGILASDKAAAYRAFDVGQYIVSFLTDKQVNFSSSLFDFGGDWEGLMLASGYMIKRPGDQLGSLTTTLKDYLRELRIKDPTGFYINNQSATPVFVMESESDYYADSVMLNIDNVKEVIQKTDTSKNYASIRFGSGAIMESLGCSPTNPNDPAFPDQIAFAGCKEEEFTVQGYRNIDSTLDLKGDWIVSSNVIAEIFFGGLEEYDSSVCFLNTRLVDSTLLQAAAGQTDIFATGTPVYYNAELFNDKVAQRYFKGIPGTLVHYLSGPTTGFRAYRTGTETITIPTTSGLNSLTYPTVPFGDDFTGSGFDLANDYGNGTAQGTLITQANSRYVAPADGIYKFTFIATRINAIATANQVPGFPPFFAATNLIVRFKIYDVANTPKGSVEQTFTPISSDVHSPNILIYQPIKYTSPSVALIATDYVVVELELVLIIGALLQAIQFPDATINPAYFELASTSFAGGVVNEINRFNYRGETYKFRAPLSESDYNLIRIDPRKKITFNTQQGKFSGAGWIQNLKRNPNLGMAEFTLVTDRN